jgi:sugar phosphate permease
MFLTPEAGAFSGLDGLWYATVLLGMAQGPLFPTSIAYLSKWLPASERSWASTMLDSGITIGSLVALPVSGWIASMFGWRSVFRLYGAMTLSFVMLWHAFSADTPAKCTYMSSAERSDLMIKIAGDNKDSTSAKKHDEAKQPCAKPGPLPVLSLLSYRPVWSLIVSHVAFNFGVYFMNSWTPTYYKEQLNLRPEDAVIHFSLPHFINLFVKAVVSKRLFDYLRSPACNFTILGCRRFFSVVGFIGMSIALFGVIAAGQNAVQATTFMSIGMGFVALHPSGFKANYMDLTLYSSGLLSGLGNTLASVASYVGPLVVGYILQTSQSWPLVFVTVSCVNVVAALGFLMFSSVQPVDKKKDE